MVAYAVHDVNTSNSVLLSIISYSNNDANGNRPAQWVSDDIEFQFPPRILSDNRSADWNEGNLPGSEPVANYKTSSAREMSLQFTYIVDDYSTDIPDKTFNGIWSIGRIKKQIVKLRGYFSLLKNNNKRSAQIVYFRYPLFTGYETWSCRIKNVNVKHGETIVGNPLVNVGSGYLPSVFPLRTDVTLDIRLWTTGGTTEDDQIQNIEGLKGNPDIQSLWF